MNIKSALFLLLATIFTSDSIADQNFQLCLNPDYAKDLTLEYNSDKSGCVVDDHTRNSFSHANSQLKQVQNAKANDTLPADALGHGAGIFIIPGSNYIPYTVVFESAHKVLGIVAHGNCNIRSERSEMVTVDVHKNGRQVSSFACYHPDDLDNTYCQQTVDSDSIGIAFGTVKTKDICSQNDDLDATIEVLIYNISN